MNSHIKNFFENYTDDLIKYIKSKEGGVNKDDIKIQGFLEKLDMLNSIQTWVAEDASKNENELLRVWLKEEKSKWRTEYLTKWDNWKTTFEGGVDIFNQKQSERFILWILKMCLKKFEEKLINIKEVVDTDEDVNNGINHIVKHLMSEVLRLDKRLHPTLPTPGKKGGKTRKRKRKGRKGKQSRRKQSRRQQSRHKGRKGKRHRRRTKKH